MKRPSTTDKNDTGKRKNLVLVAGKERAGKSFKRMWHSCELQKCSMGITLVSKAENTKTKRKEEQD
jgi:hypothetical protein